MKTNIDINVIETQRITYCKGYNEEVKIAIDIKVGNDETPAKFIIVYDTKNEKIKSWGFRQ